MSSKSEILVIPDLDEEGGADADQRSNHLVYNFFSFERLLFHSIVAHAPRNLNRKLPTRAELDNEVKASLPNSDVSIL